MAFFAAPSLLDLSDDVLLLIFSYLKSHDLISVSQTCERFSKVANDKSLWTIADFSGGRLSLRQLQRCLHFLRDTTLILILRGHRQRYSGTRRVKSPLMSASMLTSIGTKCPNLEELTLVEAYMDAEKLKMIDFAAVKSLKKLSLVNCEMDKLPDLLQEGSYFKGMYKVLPHLETLEIIGCDWLDDFDVMVISKHDKLKRLVLRSSIKVGTAVAYLALSFRFGFQNLEELDMRGTSLKDGEVNSIVHTEKLKALYLGPIGRVRRSDHSHSPHYNLVMSDPRRSEERQQVVVINMRGNRAQWRQVEEEELEGLGLQWVRNAPALRKRNPPEDQDQHYFVGEDGRPINSQNNQARREDKEEENLDQIEEEASSENDEDNSEERESSKKGEERIEDEKFCIARDASCSNDIGADHGLSPWEGHQESFIDCPDKDLTDRVIHALGSKTKNLETLVLTGCAITDSGLKEIIRKVPTLKVLDVRGTHVTATGVEEAHVSRPDCIIRGSVAR